MKLKECVKDIYLGRNSKKNRYTTNDVINNYDLLTAKAINNRFINANELDQFPSLVFIDEKFITKKDDIIISCKQPYNVVLIDEENEGILVPSNFIILRNSKIDTTFLYNYLNLLNSKMKSDDNDENRNITKRDIEEIDIIDDPKIIKKISELSKRINKRQKAYGRLLDNDQELIKMIYAKGGVLNYAQISSSKNSSIYNR